MLVAMVSLKGSPGVTTLAVALAARWPAPMRPILVEADPAGGDLGMRFSLAATPGLPSLAAAARRGDDPALLWQHAQVLPGGPAVVAAPPDAGRARAALSALIPDPALIPDTSLISGTALVPGSGLLRGAADVADAVVIVDCGRIDPGSPVMPVVHAADVMVLLTRAGADDLAHLALRVPEIGRWSARPALLLAGPGYSIAEVARELGVTPMGRVPEDPRGAAVLSGRRSALRWYRAGPARSVLGQFAREFAATLTAHQPPTPSPAATPEHPAPQDVPPYLAAPPYPAAVVPAVGSSEGGLGSASARPGRPGRGDAGQTGAAS